MAKYDFIIVGLGTAGSATCMTLAQRGYTVLGIDRFNPPHGLGSHHGHSRSVRRAYLEGTSYVSMALRSWELWRKLEKDSGNNLLVNTGNLTIGPPESPAFEGFMASARSYNIPHEFLSGAEVQKRWPQLTPPDQFVGGVEIEAGIVFPELSISTFLAEARKAGARLIMNQPVDRWSEDQQGVYVQTAEKTYEADRVLVASGGWTRKLLGLQNSQLHPKRVPVHWFEAPQNISFYRDDFPVNFWQIPLQDNLTTSHSYREFYSLPIVDRGGMVKVAFHNGLSDCDPDTLLREVLPEETDMIKTIISQYLPGLRQAPFKSEVCIYTMTPDGHFYLGKRPGANRVFGVALAGHGFKFAPVLGEILADLMVDTAPAFDVELFSPDRFAEKQVLG
jgi:sarcosine oxidase